MLSRTYVLGENDSNDCRQNDIDAAGWDIVVKLTAKVSSISSLNDVEGMKQLIAGERRILNFKDRDLRQKDAVDVFSRLLMRSAKTLRELDVR